MFTEFSVSPLSLSLLSRWRHHRVTYSEKKTAAQTVPGHDGRAGCAAIPKSAGVVDFAILSQHVNKTLPRYAQPHFIRLVDS